MKHSIMSLLVIALLASPCLADWDPGDSHKMHYPQLPDPNGWDVRGDMTTLADDFLCTGTGPITDVHFWGSWLGNLEGQIQNIHLSIHADIPADLSPTGYSMPETFPLWEYDVFDDFGIRPVDPPSLQGWYDPLSGEFIEQDHDAYYQYNIYIPEPLAFHQQEGTIYWLDVRVDLPAGGTINEWGWKTSMSPHFNDDAVYWDPTASMWQELRDPITQESLDLAFVITPEPASISLLLLGGLVLLRRR